jgi:hypothetical protein
LSTNPAFIAIRETGGYVHAGAADPARLAQLIERLLGMMENHAGRLGRLEGGAPGLPVASGADRLDTGHVASFVEEFCRLDPEHHLEKVIL